MQSNGAFSIEYRDGCGFGQCLKCASPIKYNPMGKKFKGRCERCGFVTIYEKKTRRHTLIDLIG